MKARLFFTVGSVLFFIIILFLLEKEGVSSRVYVTTSTINDNRMPVYILDKTTDIYRLWRKKSVRGRIVINVSKYLHFIDFDNKAVNDLILKALTGKVEIRNEYEKDLNYKNLLLLAVEGNIARQVYHVLPSDVFREKVVQLKGGNAPVEAGEIVTNYKGSNRTMLSDIPQIKEPVILNIDASYFYSSDPSELAKELKSSGLKVDLMTFCLAKDNPEVTDAERERLMEFVRRYFPNIYGYYGYSGD